MREDAPEPWLGEQVHQPRVRRVWRLQIDQAPACPIRSDSACNPAHPGEDGGLSRPPHESSARQRTTRRGRRDWEVAGDDETRRGGERQKHARIELLSVKGHESCPSLLAGGESLCAWTPEAPSYEGRPQHDARAEDDGERPVDVDEYVEDAADQHHHRPRQERGNRDRQHEHQRGEQTAVLLVSLPSHSRFLPSAPKTYARNHLGSSHVAPSYSD
jgi:hypothetical protein